MEDVEVAVHNVDALRVLHLLEPCVDVLNGFEESDTLAIRMWCLELQRLATSERSCETILVNSDDSLLLL